MFKLTAQRILSCIFLLSFSAKVLAQVEVVEVIEASSNTGQKISNTTNSSSYDGNNDSNAIVLNLYLQLEALQGEVQTLRGTVEEQNYRIKRMQADSRDRYLDIDNRLSNLSSSRVSPETTTQSLPTNGSSANGSPTVTVPNILRQTPQLNQVSSGVVIREDSFSTVGGGQTSNPVTPAFSGDERELYRTAFNLLIEDSNYLESSALFQQYMEVYPQGNYIANAYYWQGEALILLGRFNQAKEVFSTLINDYPEHAKAPGAFLKLVVIYLRMNNNQQALTELGTLQARYPDSLTEIDAAQQYLRDAGL